MRLSDYLIRPINTSTEQSGQYNLQLEAYNLAVNLINRMTQPTVCDIEQIRAEIADRLGLLDCKKDILAIIDKYTKGDKE